MTLLWGFRRISKENSADSIQKKSILLRTTLEKLGSVFVKMGQFLSMRPDFLPLEYCEEMFYLLEDVDPFPETEMYRIFAKEFGKKPEQLFTKFEKKPFASASFGQVYTATLKSGEKVAVKLRRPNMRKKVQQDIAIMKVLAGITKVIPGVYVDFGKIVREFEQWVFQELDYEQEALSARQFFQQYRHLRDCLISPQVFAEFCTAQILTTEFIEGITVNKILQSRRKNQKKIPLQLKKIGITPQFMSDIIFKTFSRQFFTTGVFHADPHPANIIFTPDKKLACIDFGIMGVMPKKQRLLLLRYIRSLLVGDVVTSTQVSFEYCDTSRIKDKEKVRKAHMRLVREYYALFQEMDSRQLLPGESRHWLGKFLFKAISKLEEYGGVIPDNTLKFFRAISMIESLLLYVNPDLKIEEMARKYRNFSLAYALSELPSFFEKENMNALLHGAINSLEKTLLDTLSEEEY